MQPTTDPIAAVVEDDGRRKPPTTTVRRRIGDMAGMYLDADAGCALTEGDDPVVHEVFRSDVPPDVYPGEVGGEVVVFPSAS